MTGMWKRRSVRIPVFLSLLFTLSLPCAGAEPPQPRTAEGTPAYVERLVEEGRRLQLHADRYWRTLLHYQRTLTGLQSLVDDPRFFLSPRGKRDPAAELEATIRSFFLLPTPDAKHPVCRFVARYHWIKERLGLDPATLPAGECVPFTRLIADMKPASTTLVFPASHMNSPASMFGHTLLAYETESGSKLLAYAVNYSAVTTETFGPLFAVKGLFGLYQGYFSVLPYYAKLQEYSDLDQRDLWEYSLTFTREETIRSIMHVYELDGIASDYFFFDENCSYNLLFLLDAGRPSLALTDRTVPWVIPVDTIRKAEAAGLISRAVYRPSKTTRIQHLASLLDDGERRLARAAARGEAGPERILAAGMPRQDAIRTLDLAVEYLQYQYAKREVTQEVYTDRFLKLLGGRSTLGALEGGRDEAAVPPRPEAGHRSNRLQVGVGVKKGEAFQEIRLRPAYHALTDPSGGYLAGSQIVFLDTRLRYSDEGHDVTLEQLDLVDIVSVAPRDDFFTPLSWKVTAGLARRTMRDGRDRLVGLLSPGSGLAVRLGPLGLGYAMLEVDANLGDRLEEKYAVGAGGSFGILAQITRRWSLAVSGRGLYYGLGDRHSLLEAKAAQGFALTPNLAISAEVVRRRAQSFYQTEGTVSLAVFF